MKRKEKKSLITLTPTVEDMHGPWKFTGFSKNVLRDGTSIAEGIAASQTAIQAFRNAFDWWIISETIVLDT